MSGTSPDRTAFLCRKGLLPGSSERVLEGQPDTALARVSLEGQVNAHEKGIRVLME